MIITSFMEEWGDGGDNEPLESPPILDSKTTFHQF